MIEEEEEAMVMVTGLTRRRAMLMHLMVNKDLNETIYNVIIVKRMDTLNHSVGLKINH